MQKRLIGIVGALFFFSSMWAGTNLQVYYDFGSLGTAVPNQRSQRITTTLELCYADPWGSTYGFVDIDFAIHPNDPRHTAFFAYGELARCLNFWHNTPAKDLSIQIEYNGGIGVHHAGLIGLNYGLHTADNKNLFQLELLYKYIADSYNGWRNSVPLQFTFVWNCFDFCTAPGLSFHGFVDIWGQRHSDGQSWVMLSEPQLWYNIGRWFKCPYLHIGTEIEMSFNFTGSGFMCNPCVGIKWAFD